MSEAIASSTTAVAVDGTGSGDDGDVEGREGEERVSTTLTDTRVNVDDEEEWEG